MDPEKPVRNTAALRRRNKAVVLQMLEAFNKQDTEIVTKLLHPNVRSRTKNLLNPEMQRMPVADRVRLEMINDYNTFPDGHFEVRDIVAEENKVILHWTFTGTHKGELFGRQATGRQVNLVGHEIVTLDRGRIIDHTDDHAMTLLDMLGQLGMLDQEMQQRLGIR